MRIVAPVLSAGPRICASESAQSGRPCARRIRSASAGVPAERPPAHAAQVKTVQRRGGQQRGHLRGGLLGPEVAPLGALGADGVGQRRAAAHRDRRDLAARHRVEPDRGPGPRAADALRVEREHRAPPAGPQAAGPQEQVRLGRRADDRAAEVDDHPGQPPGLAAAAPADDQDVLLDRLPQPVPVLRPAEAHRMRGRADDPLRTDGRPGRTRPDPRSAADRDQCSHRPGREMNPRPGCSRRRSRSRSVATRNHGTCRRGHERPAQERQRQQDSAATRRARACSPGITLTGGQRGQDPGPQRGAGGAAVEPDRRAPAPCRSG